MGALRESVVHCEKRTAPAGEDAGDGESSQPSLRCIPDDGEDDSDHDANVRADHAEGDSVAVRFIPFFFFLTTYLCETVYPICHRPPIQPLASIRPAMAALDTTMTPSVSPTERPRDRSDEAVVQVEMHRLYSSALHP